MTNHPWHANDDYWAAVYDCFFGESAFAQAALIVPKLLTLSGCTGGNLLDLACGPGRHAIPFARLGFKVTGVDRTPLLLERAKEVASRQGICIEWVLDDMRRFVRPNTFDFAVSLFTSFGYFEDLEENRTVLRNVCTSLKGGGVFLIDVMGKEVVARNFQGTGSTALPNGDLFFERRQIVEDWSKAQTEITIVSGGRSRTFPVRLWIFSAFELKTLLLSAGFTNVTMYGDFEGAQYGTEGKRLIAVARK